MILQAQEILHKHKLKRTSCREGIIQVIMNASEALSEHDISEQLSGNYDRTTFYRSFKTLIEKKIIHKIVVDNQMVKYALDNLLTHKQPHAHFYCQVCNCVLCMDNAFVEIPKLPDGYIISESELILKGLCSKCNSHN
jgi:Fur family ferric uptake transcriptional regulator